MTPTSPPSSSTTTNPSKDRPPARNKSSSSLSTHTLRSLSSTSTGKPRRNKSAVSLHHGHGHGHGHGAGHHNVQFTSHRKSSHGAHGSQAMKRRNSSQSSGSTGGGAGGNPFGLGMTSMTRSDSQDGGEDIEDRNGGVQEGQGANKAARPDLGPRRTSSSSSTTTIVGGGGGSRSRSRGGAKRQNSGDVRGRESASANRGGGGSRSRAGSKSQQESQERDQNKITPSGSVTSTTDDWASETDSPLHFGKKLPDVEVQKEFKPEGTSGLAMALEGDQVQQGPQSHHQKSRNATPSRLRKSKFQFAEDEDDDDDEEEEKELPAEIPAAAMPPAQTPALPTLPAMLEAITPARSPDPDEVRAPESPTPEQTQETAALQAPAAPSAPQGISPPGEEEFGQPPPVAGPELSRSPSPMPSRSSPSSKERNGRPGVDEPSLAQAANVDEPNMAIEADKEHQQKHQGLKSLPRPSPRGRDSPSHSNKVTPEEGRSPAGPTPTMLQEQEGRNSQPPAKQPPPPSHPSPSSSSQLPRPVRAHPTRKSSNASVMSMASARSAAPSLISRMAPPPHFRRSGSGIAPTVSREAVVRGEMATPSPEPIAEDGQARGGETAKSRRNGGRSSTFSHQRTSSQTSNHSFRSPSATDSPSRRSNTYAAGEIQRSRTTEPSSSGGGGALAALGQIHQAATARTPSLTSPGGASEGARTPGALTNAKRSASGYFSSALRGLTSLPSALTPPLSPSAGASSYTGAGNNFGGKHPIPGSSGAQAQQGGGGGGSYSRSGGRTRSSPSPQQPPLIVKFLEQPTLPPPSNASNQEGSTASTSPRQSRPSALSPAHRNASSASLAMSRTQQKALLARDAPSNLPPATSSNGTGGVGVAGGGGTVGLAPPPSPVPTSASHAHPYLPSNPPPPSSSPSPAAAAASSNSAANANGMQKWAFGLIKEAERIERQWRCIEKWRDPVGESLERVLHSSSSSSTSMQKSRSRAMERGGGGSGSASGRESGSESTSNGGGGGGVPGGNGKLVRIQKGRSLTAY